MAGDETVNVTLEQVRSMVAEAVEEETAALKKEILALKSDNKKLNDKIAKLEWDLDEAEQ